EAPVVVRDSLLPLRPIRHPQHHECGRHRPAVDTANVAVHVRLLLRLGVAGRRDGCERPRDEYDRPRADTTGPDPGRHRFTASIGGSLLLRKNTCGTRW